jgi:hypothetical protein
VVYVLQQSQRHGLSDDPAHDGSSLPDLFGWRRQVVPRPPAAPVRDPPGTPHARGPRCSTPPASVA